MRRWKILISILAGASLLFGGSLALAQPAILTQQQLDMLSQYCATVQVNLNQLEKHDAVARINRGREYDQLLNQIIAFNQRLDYNHITLTELTLTTGQLQTAIDTFRADYDTYDQQLNNVVTAECKSKPQDFYNQIVKAREAREALNTQVTTIDTLTATYRDQLVQYQATLTQ